MTMPVNPDMPACRLFDDIFSRWLTQFEQWKRITLPPEALHQLAFDYSNQTVADYSRRLTRELGTPFKQHIDAAIYALVALLDETVLYSDWPALSWWQDCPLEYHLWQTHSAGDQFPAHIQALLNERNPAQRDLAALYLRCLTLGFGVKRDNFDEQAHQETCRLLWHFAFQEEAQMSGIAQKLNADSLASPLQLPPRRRLPDNSRLHLIAFIVLLALLLLSQRLWLSIEDAIGVSTLPNFPVTQYCEGDRS
ncbi:DotU family type IV/VI secretion system protein [Salmonella bongori]|uniref:DotU family type IV/VI secretion system protein n=4 Tax=Salmonella TaxID=590 RepID=A0A750P3J2_SALER|nr:T6SS protein Cts2U [Salmonella bongori]ECG8258677.1 T6SS protein Cts2U [Salmonella bongori serovar 48:i:-]EGE4660429.1 DotU family type IV/VI secretion system protein [Salmonella bongori serovar 48:i:- str. 94-0708]EGS1130467.1 DotU family type IV/VI secretion system protein [Salmonella bongori CFSAN000509]MBA2136493.1 DotU family type IV/VI secretion system protein [Salmonella bongori serovar 66:z39:-]MBA2167991.1 DotU family type IV/VI secretion system protein [Salmonella bongori serovar 